MQTARRRGRNNIIMTRLPQQTYTRSITIASFHSPTAVSHDRIIRKLSYVLEMQHNKYLYVPVHNMSLCVVETAVTAVLQVVVLFCRPEM